MRPCGRFSGCTRVTDVTTNGRPQSMDLAIAHNHYHAGRLDLAESACRRDLSRDPLNADALHLLGVISLKASRLDGAVDLLRQAIASRPAFPDAYSNLAVALEARGQLTKAENACRAALRLDSRHVGAWDNLGNVLKKQGRAADAADAFRSALSVLPDDPVAYSGLGAAMLDLCRLDDAVACYHRSSDLQPHSPAAHSDLLYNLHYHDGYDAATLHREHVEWDRRHAAPLRSRALPHPNDRTPGRRLRVGYVSPDFREHTVPRFVSAALEHTDRHAFEVFLYSDVTSPDPTTERLRGLGHAWRDCATLPNDQLDRLIHQDAIDILVDLRGHGGNNRLPLFARKPAPIQVTMVGYFNTTGLSAMDYRVTDAAMDPPGETERYHAERLVRLPHTCWCYRPDDESPDVAPPPVLATGHVTFASLNKVAKISPTCARLWARVLDAVPDSRLLLSAAGGDARGTLRARLAEMGLPPGRIDIADKAPTRRTYLERFARIDVALDTFPFNGITTTCDALWMGVPVVNLAGETIVSRAGRSILNAAGLGHLSMLTPEAFIFAAITAAADRHLLRSLREGMRDRIRSSALLNAAGFAAALEAEYRRMWLRWCEAA
jgi:predicted O-linked N-acetylglucosamine transferase (SPINDLY family)